MGKAGDKEEPEEDEPDPVQAGRLSNRKVRLVLFHLMNSCVLYEMLLI